MSGHEATLIRDPAERQRRRFEKQLQILHWLRRNTWSTSDVLREVIGLNSRQGAHAILKALARDGFVRSARISADFGSPIYVWGITPHGAAMAANPGEPIEARTFEPSKVKLATVGHTIDLQRMQLQAERSGWRWLAVTGEFARNDAKYPDALALRLDGQKVAIEIERTVKTLKRYAEILAAHLAARQQQKWDWIYYLCPDLVIRDRVRRAFHEIRHVNWRGQRIDISDNHLQPFRFYAYTDDWVF